MIEKLQSDLLKNYSKLVFGTDRVLKLLRNDKLSRVYLSRNCKDNVRNDIKTISKDTEIIELEYVNSEVGTICKKPFPISVVGLQR